MKKSLLITIIIVITLGIVAIVYWWPKKQTPETLDKPTETTSTQISQTTQPIQSENQKPIGDTFIIQTPKGGVEVKNFYTTAIDESKTSLLIKRTDQYDITYFKENSSFLITLTESPISQSRREAEIGILELLNTPQEDACKLEISIGIPNWVDKNLAGSNFPLSFCSGN